MNNAKSAAILAAFSFVPYLAVAWGYTVLVDGGTKEFWSALGVLVGIRFFFGVIETLGSVLSWRAYGRGVMVETFVKLLRANNFPKRTYAHDNFLNYLARIEDDPNLSASVKTAAKQFYFVLETFENIGIVAGMRMHSAAELALEQYSPRAAAPIYGVSAA